MSKSLRPRIRSRETLDEADRPSKEIKLSEISFKKDRERETVFQKKRRPDGTHGRGETTVFSYPVQPCFSPFSLRVSTDLLIYAPVQTRVEALA